MFKDVNLQFSTKRKIFNTELSDFKLSVQLNAQGDEDAPVKLSANILFLYAVYCWCMFIPVGIV